MKAITHHDRQRLDAIALDRDEKMFVERMEGLLPQFRQRRFEIAGAYSFAVEYAFKQI